MTCATAKTDKIKINVETIDDFRAQTKHLYINKIEYFTHRLKNEKDISAVIRNLPICVTEAEIMEELNNQNYPIKSITRITNKNNLSSS